VARAAHAEALVFVSNVPGLLADGRLVEHLTPAEAEALVAQVVIAGGMLPKVRAALEAAAAGVAAVRITNLEGLAEGKGTLVAGG
jgi:acetylglutamate kinase